MRAAGGIWLILVAAVALATCKDEGPSCSLSGTLTYLGTGGFNLSGHAFSFSLDDDAVESNGSVKTFTGTWSSGSTHQYTFDVKDFAPGSYYLYAVLTEPATYQIYGWYNTDPAQPFNPRVQVSVQCGSNYSFDIDAT